MYQVRYGFGKDLELLKDKFLNSRSDYYEDDILIKSPACFSSYIRDRRELKSAIKSPCYYSLSCNKETLIELIKWVNSVSNGLKIKLERSRCVGYAISYRYEKNPDSYLGKTIYEDFKFGKPIKVVQKRSLGELKPLNIHRCAIKISVTKNKSNLSKILLEYLTLVLFRTIDIGENFFCNMLEGKSIVERILDATTGLWGHGLCEHKISIDELIKCLNIESVEEICDGEKYIGQLRFGLIAQTSIINSILERTN